jgi:RNA recognition motif-containing protein
VTARSRGFGFVDFFDPDVIDEVLETAPHAIDDKTVSVQRALPRGSQGFITTKPKKVHLGRIPPDATESELYAFFDEFFPDSVHKVQFCGTSATTGLKSALMSFVNGEVADRVCQLRYFFIRKHLIEAKIAHRPDSLCHRIKGKMLAIGLPYHINEYQLKESFSEHACHGRLEEVEIIRDPMDRNLTPTTHHGFALISFR